MPGTRDNNVMHTNPDLRVFLKWMIAGSGSVITDVIPLSSEPPINCEILTFELLAMDVINGWLNKTN